MGWREILNGMWNGPRGQRQPTKDSAGGGMSPIMMVLLGYLAYKTFKGSAGGQSPITPDRSPNDRATNGELIDKLGRLLRSGKLSQSAWNMPVRGSSGDIADMVRVALKTVLGGAGAGAVLSGGLGTLLKEFQQRGQGPAAQTWVSTGPKTGLSRQTNLPMPLEMIPSTN
jgi:YidB-like protein